MFAVNNLGLNMFFYQADLFSGNIGVSVADVSVPQLTSILSYHVASDVLPLANLTDGTKIDTLAGR